MKMIVTGGAGFIGSNFINYWLSKHKNDSIINIDKLTYASNPEYVRHKEFGSRYKLVKGDVADLSFISETVKDSDVIVNFAAESHVDNSIASPEKFMVSNYMGVFSLLESVRKYDIRFHQISTDEVYGSLPLNSPETFDENSRYNPKNPYSASKAAADLLVNSYYNTYGIKATISNCSNNFGPNQHIEKLIPKTITLALKNEKIPIYGNGEQIRDWIYVEDHCTAVESILEKGKLGETYLVSSRNEQRNIDVVKKILSLLGKNHDLINFVSDRPGHDVRYAINPEKLEKATGWKSSFQFDKALEMTIKMYTQHK
jgi:dTDP-glucose 4,6-dehydratase